MSIEITYVDTISLNAPEMAVTTNDGRRWNIRYYNGEWGFYGWVAKTYVGDEAMRPDITFEGLPDLFSHLIRCNSIKLIPFWEGVE